MVKSRFALVISLVMFLTLFGSFGSDSHTQTAHAADPTLPALMITEITPDTFKVNSTPGSPDAFEFIELYNNTNAPINLKNYKIVYETPTVYNWVIKDDKYIDAGGTFVVWVSVEPSATYADFNRNYGTSLASSRMYKFSSGGMANSGSRTISIANPANTVISTASYVTADVTENQGIAYGFPLDGSKVMRNLGKGTATPGALIAGQVPASPPKIMITEVTPDSLKVDGTSGTPDAFEFIELYNNTNTAINLKNYSIVYETPTVYNWVIDENKTIPAYGTFVIWITPVTAATLTNFNNNYGTSLTASQVFRVTAAGLANSAARTLSIADPAGTPLSTVHYSASDVAENQGIVYLYPTDGTRVMRKLGAGGLGTPGTLQDGQVPTLAVPAGLQAISGDGQVTLTWLGASGATSYRIYKDGALYTTVPASLLTTTVTGLGSDLIVKFQVSSVNASGYESARSAVVPAAASSLQVTQGAFVSPPSGSFPEYTEWFTKATPGPYIPGLAEDLIPQGMAYLESEDWYLISYYRYNGKSSVIAVIDATTGSFIKAMTIYMADYTPFTGHVGGTTITNNHVWLACEGSLFHIPLADIISATDRSHLFIEGKFATGSRSSYSMYNDGVLWSGEFFTSGYATDPLHHMTATDGNIHRAWITGFTLNPSTGLLPSGKMIDENTAVVPDYILSVPDIVQGIEVVDNKYIALSRSFGRANNSIIETHKYVLSGSPDTYVTVKGKSVPVWFLDDNSRTSELTALPMTEGMVAHNGKLQVLIESGATHFASGAKYRTDRLWAIDLMPKLMITEITPDSLKLDGTPGTPDAFEFVELYNATDEPISLKDYTLVYETPTVYKWVINENKTIPAKGTFVIWITPETAATLADFNINYGTSLTSSQVFRVTAAGLSNSAARTLSIETPQGVILSEARYASSDVSENVGINYRYPTNGSNVMRKMSSSGLATPGVVLSGQTP